MHSAHNLCEEGNRFLDEFKSKVHLEFSCLDNIHVFCSAIVIIDHLIARDVLQATVHEQLTERVIGPRAEHFHRFQEIHFVKEALFFLIAFKIRFFIIIRKRKKSFYEGFSENLLYQVQRNRNLLHIQ